MRILLVSSGSGSRGGGELFLLKLGQGLAARGHAPALWTADHSRMDSLDDQFRSFAEVIRYPYKNTYDHPARSLSFFATFRHASDWIENWKAWKPDVLHINKQNLEDGLDLLAAAEKSRIPSACTVHLTQTARYLGARAAWLRDAISRWRLRQYSGPFIAVHPSRAQELEQVIGRHVETILNGVPPLSAEIKRSLRQQTRNELGFKNDDFVVMSCGRLEEQKQPALFLEIAKRLHQQKTNIQFLWVGDGSLAKFWDEFVHANNLSDCVRRLPWQEDVTRFYAAADCYLHCAAFEGLSFSVLEAWASGLPLILRRQLAEETPEMLEQGCLPFDGIKDGIEAVLTVYKKNASSDCPNSFPYSFSLEAMIDRYEALYQSLLKT